MENWLVQQLRFSAFVPAATPDLLTAIWPLISAEPPESEESRPREGFRRMAAPETDSVLEAVFLPGRFDIVKSQATTGEIQPTVHFGDASPQLRVFADRIYTLLDGIDDKVKFFRLALGVILLRPAASREAAYDDLGKLLPVEIDATTSRDFLYQINHPESFLVGKLSIELNRLSRWSSVRIQHFMLHVVQNLAGEPMPARSGLVAGENFVRCEIDNSSTAEMAEELPRDSLRPILSRLIELADVTAKGECREAS
jgi:hypothetical protein